MTAGPYDPEGVRRDGNAANVPFVGRQAELDTLRALSRRAVAERHPAAAIVTGPPGSGKTRLLTELLQQSPAIRQIRVVGYEPTQPIPLAAISELLRQLMKVPVHGAILEGLVFGTHDSGAPDSATRDPLRIFEAAHRTLSSVGPFVLAIDDLQWVDELSLGLIHYLIRAAEPGRQVMVVIAVARPSPAGAAFRQSLDADLPADRRAIIELGSLPLEDGLALARVIDPGLDLTAAADLWRRARGSPFWLEALARGTDTNDPSRLIGERLRELSDDAGTLLAALAVGSRPFEIDDVARVLEWQADRVRYVARELIVRGLALGVAGHLQLSHDLIREAAVAALPVATRRRMHARLAKVIESTAGTDLQMLCEALGHRGDAGLPTAELAAQVLSSPQRRLLGGEGLRLLSTISDGLDAGIPEQLMLDSGIGELAAILGEQELAMDRWARVSDRCDDPSTRQRAGLEAARAAYRLSRSADAHRHLDGARAVATMTPGMTVDFDALEAEIELWLDHETAAGCRTAERAVATAEEIAGSAGGIDRLPVTARRAHLAALEAACDGALQEDRGADVIRLSASAARVARELDEEAYVAALIRSGFALRPLGRVREAEQGFRQAWDIARRQIMPTAMHEAGQGLARTLRDLGRLAEARQIATETAQLAARLGHPPGRWGNARSIVHAIDLSMGDPMAALQALRLDAATERDPHYRQTVHQTIALWHARFAGVGQAIEVEAELGSARADSALARCPRCAAELSIVSVELLARIGRLQEAELALEAWERQATADYLMRQLWRSRATAAIAMAAGDHEAATSILEPYAEELERAGLLDDLLWARLDLGRSLARIDRDRSVKAFTQAADLAERMGAVSQGRLAAQELRRLGIRAWRRGRATSREGLDSLSEREREVGLLVADGQSNREIAETLLVSPKTIERHLTNLLAKLGLRNRTELAALVHSMAVRGSPDE